MQFFKNLKTFLDKIEEYNAILRPIIKEKQFQKQKHQVEKYVKKMQKRNKIINNFYAQNTKNNQLQSESMNSTKQSPFDEMYYANHEEYGAWEKEYISLSSRFQSKQCPYCQKIIEKLSTRSRVCPYCKGKLVIKKNICSQEYMLLSQEEFQPLYQERLSFDWDRYTAEALFHLKRKDFGLYRNAKYNLLVTGFELHKFPPYEMLIKCFELYYLDFSGPNNVHGLSSSLCPPFKQDTLIPPAVLEWVEFAIENYPQTLEQYEQIFLTEMEKIRLPQQQTLPKTAWNKLKTDVIDILRNLHEDEY